MQNYSRIRCHNWPKCMKWQICEILMSQKFNVLQYIVNISSTYLYYILHPSAESWYLSHPGYVSLHRHRIVKICLLLTMSNNVYEHLSHMRGVSRENRPYDLCQCHTKRRMGMRGLAHPSFSMTPTFWEYNLLMMPAESNSEKSVVPSL